MEEEDFLNTTIPIELPEGALWYLTANLVAVMVVGVIGNLLTLVALPYVRYRYGEEFSLLQTSSSSLLLHLSLCDLLYCIIGIPHFIEVYIVGYFPHSATLCWWLGMVRHLVAYADFATIAVIAICVCCHNLCKTCQEGGSRINHSDHDNIFGGRRIYIIFISIWVSAFLYISVDIFDFAGTYGWSAGPYGCSSISNEAYGHVNYCGMQHFLGVLINLIIIIFCYSLVAVQLWRNKKLVENFNPEEEEKAKILTWKNQITIFSLCLTYVVFILPALLFDWATCVRDDVLLDTVFIMLYFWVYAINFIIYVMSNSRLRAAYSRFLCDFCRLWVGASTPTGAEESSSSPWWLSMKKSFSKVRHSITHISQSIVGSQDLNEQKEQTIF